MSWTSTLPSEVRREFELAQRRSRGIIAKESEDVVVAPRVATTGDAARRRIVETGGEP